MKMTESILPAIYPRLIRRVQAFIIDSFIFAFFSLGAFLLVTPFEVEPIWARMVIALVPIFFFEPVLISYTGGTIGHHLMKLKVQDVGNAKKINIFLAFIRFILKTLLGVISLMFILIRVLACFLVSERCIENNMCTPFENVIIISLGIIWVISVTLILVGGWKSLLFGCKRKKIETPEAL